ncbi:TPA: hypothetical protein DCX16_06425 [bacterium]|nr:hypothetical protein [bacterium]
MKRWLVLIFVAIVVILIVLLIPKKEGERPIFFPKEDKIKIRLFFPDEQAEYFVVEEREVEKKEKEEDIARLIIRELLKGPTNEDLYSAIPEGTKLREIYIYEDVLYVDFSPEISNNHPGGSTGEIMTIFSVVNSLCANLTQYSVQILIDGKPQETLAGHIVLYEPLAFKKDMVK